MALSVDSLIIIIINNDIQSDSHFISVEYGVIYNLEEGGPCINLGQYWAVDIGEVSIRLDHVGKN